MQTHILSSRVEFVDQPCRVPLILSSGVISELTEARVEVAVRVAGREATGRASVYLSDLWAWPDPSLSHATRDAALRDLCRQIAADLWPTCGGSPAHPLELGLRLHESISAPGASSATGGIAPPLLARIMCASPFDAAIHDAAGIALDRSAFSFYDSPHSLPLAQAALGDADAYELIARLFRRRPKRRLRAWYIVGRDDTRRQWTDWIRGRGYHCLKVRLLGRDLAEDAARTAGAYRQAVDLDARDIELSADANEGYPDPAGVMEYLQKLRAAEPGAYDALRYIEQPTSRDIRTHRHDWRGIAALKPVMLDEGLTSLDQMAEARSQGWSGFALKACKGHSFCLVAAAWARQHGMSVAMQDLTNPGLALIQAAIFAAHVETINDVELNSPQFTPAANANFLPRLAALFEPTNGFHELPAQLPPGLGSKM